MIIFEHKNLRISLITPRLLRTEKGAFTDLPTQTVQCRDLGGVEYNLYDREKTIVISTEAASFSVDKKSGNVTEQSTINDVVVVAMILPFFYNSWLLAYFPI